MALGTMIFSEALEDCLLLIGEGQDISVCLERYPEHAERLRPHLEVVIRLRASAVREDMPLCQDIPTISLDAALSNCIRLLARGYTVEQCYAHYPEYKTQLAPWLTAVVDLRKNGSVGMVKNLYPDAHPASGQITFEEILEESLRSVAQGASPESVLTRYPYYYDRLRPWVYRVRELQKRVPMESGPRPLPIGQPVKKTRKPAPRQRMQTYTLNTFLSLLLTVVFLFGSTGLVKAASSSLPGDVFYPIKLGVENAQLLMVPAEEQVVLKQKFARERVTEAAQLIQLGRVENIILQGEIILDRQNGRIFLSGVPIEVADQAKITEQLGDGAVIRIEGQTTAFGTFNVISLQIIEPGSFAEVPSESQASSDDVPAPPVSIPVTSSTDASYTDASYTDASNDEFEDMAEYYESLTTQANGNSGNSADNSNNGNSSSSNGNSGSNSNNGNSNGNSSNTGNNGNSGNNSNNGNSNGNNGNSGNNSNNGNSNGNSSNDGNNGNSGNNSNNGNSDNSGNNGNGSGNDSSDDGNNGGGNDDKEKDKDK